MMSVFSAFKTRWFWYSMLSILCWGGWTLTAKLTLNLKEISETTMQFLFPFGCLPVVVVLLASRQFKLEKSPRGVFYGIANGVLAGIGMVALFAAYRTEGNAAVITTATAMYPLITVVLAMLVLRERLTRLHLVGLAFAVAAFGLFSVGADEYSIHLAPWIWYGVIALVMWGIVGLLQKLSTNYLSAESALVWLVVGYFLIDPLLFPRESILNYSAHSLTLALLSALLNAVGAWALLAAMKSGGKASIVVPMTALYPIVMVFMAPIVLHESITTAQAGGVVSALIAVALLST